jgi:hypothetical protein
MRNCWIVHAAVGCSVTFQWMIRRVPTSRTTKIEDTEAGRHGGEEVTGEDRGCMIPDERGPTLGRSSATRRPHGPEISSDGARRDRQSERQESFMRDAFLAPGRVRPGHGDDQPLQVSRNRRPAGPGLPSPEEPPAQAVPADQRVRLDDREQRTPVQQPGEQHERDARGRVGPPRLRVTLLVERQLCAEEQVLRRQMDVSPSRTKVARSRRRRRAVEDHEGRRRGMEPVSLPERLRSG